MNIRTLLASGLLAAVAVLPAAAQVTYVEDPDPLINDYVSIGEFDADGDTEGWNRNTGAIAPLTVANGVLEVTTTAGDPWFFRAGIADLPPEFTLVEVRLQIVAGSGSGWEMFWGHSGAGQGGFSGLRRIDSTLAIADNEWHVVQYDMTEALAGNSLTDFRIDPGQGAGNRIAIDYVRVGTISADSDGDGLPDSVETGTGVFVSSRDTGTQPNNPDTDGDGVSDGIEVQFQTDPNDPAVFPVPSIDRFTANPATYVVGVEIPPNAPSVSNGTPTSFQIAPALPAGLVFSTSTGTISGTPTAPSPTTDYTVTANFAGGKTATRGLTLTVRNPYIDFTVAQQTFKVGAFVNPFRPNYYGPEPTSFRIAPALPEGLDLDPATGDISGQPTTFQTPTSYTVTATYAGSPEATAELILTILEDPVVTIDPEKVIADYVSLGEFEDAADTAGLFQNSIQTPFEVADGDLKVVTIGDDPYFGRGGLAAGDANKTLEFRLRATTDQFFAIRMYWSEDAPGRGMSEATAFTLPDVPLDGEYHTFQVDFTRATVGPFTAIRLDPGGGAGISFDLDYLRLGSFLPRLQATTEADGRLRISWPASAGDFTLQSTTALPGGWNAEGATVQTEGDRRFILVTPSGAARFYRLTQ